MTFHRLERDVWQKRFQEAQKQITELENFKQMYSQQLQESVGQLKIDLHRQHANAMATIEVDRTKLDGRVYE